MKRAAVAVGVVLALLVVAVAVAPSLAAGMVKKRVVAECEARGLRVTLGGVGLGWQRTTVRDFCLLHPERDGVELACVDHLTVALPLLRAARGDVVLGDVEVTGGFLNVSGELGTLPEVRELYEGIVARVTGDETDASEGSGESTPSTPAARSEPVLPTVLVNAFTIRTAGHLIVPLAAARFDDLVVRRGEGQWHFQSGVGLQELRLAALPLNAAPDRFDIDLSVADDGEFGVAVTLDTPVVIAPDELAGGHVAFGAVSFTPPNQFEVGAIEVVVPGQDTPVLTAERFRLRPRTLTTEIDEFFMDSAELVSPVVHLALAQDGTPEVLRALGLAPEAQDDPVDAGDGEDGDPDEAEDAAAQAAVAAGNEPPDRAPPLWDGRRWWEKLPQSWDIRDATVTLTRDLGDETRALTLQTFEVEYALRAIGTQLDVEIGGEMRFDGADAGEFGVIAVWNWATSSLHLDLEIEALDLAALSIPVPALESKGLHGALDLQTRFRERTDGTITDFSGRVGLTDFGLEVGLLNEPLSIASFAYSWRARVDTDAETQPLRFVDGDGSLGAAEFYFRPVIHGFDYENPRLGDAFDVHFGVPDQDAMALLDAFPDGLIGAVADARMRGQWGFDVEFPITWTEVDEETGRMGIDIGESSVFDVRDADVHLDWLPAEIDVRRLNEELTFTFRGPGNAINRPLRIRAPRSVPSYLRGDDAEQDEEAWQGETEQQGEPEPEQGEPRVGSAGWARLTEISYFVTAATLYREDGRFFRNRGINWYQWRAVLEEAWLTRELGRGASTISMQLIKNVFLSHERSIERKLQELFLTYWATRLVPKERLLEVYLNVIEWGPGINGVVEAARYYFGKSPGDLSLEESVWLSSIVPAPIRRGRQRASGVAADWSMRHCHDVMTGMQGRGWITHAELTKGLNAPIRFVTAPDEEPPPRRIAFDLDDPGAGLDDLRLPSEAARPTNGETGRLGMPPQERVRSLISGQIELRP